MTERRADTRYPIHELLARRWSPRAFAPQSVARDQLRSLFEAARWAPSSYNEQPWGFIVATKEEPAEYQRLLDCLVEFNQGWARWAPVLVATVARRQFARNNAPNAHAWHDVGLATQNLIVQATALGLYVHPMAGFDADKIRTTYGVPDDCEPVAALAIGHMGDAAALPEDLRAQEEGPRQRRPLGELVFSGSWGRSAALLEE